VGGRRRSSGAVALAVVLAVAPAAPALALGGGSAPGSGVLVAGTAASATPPGADPVDGGDGGEDGQGDDDGGLWYSPAPTGTAPGVPAPSVIGPSGPGPSGVGTAGVGPTGTPAAAAALAPGPGDGHDLVLHAFLVLDCVVISGAAFSYGRRARRAARRGRARTGPPHPGTRR